MESKNNNRLDTYKEKLMKPTTKLNMLQELQKAKTNDR